MKAGTALIAGSALYAAGAFVLARALRQMPSAPEVPSEALPRAAVLVAARNEAHTIRRCLTALRAQAYPAGRLEIVVADDASSDDTARLAREAGQGPGHPVTVLSLDEPPPGSALRGKARALHAALGASNAPLLLVTDADCAPPPRWAARMAAAFAADPGLGLVGGLTTIDARPGHTLDALQARDWAWLLGGTAALAALGRPVTAMGNNMAFRREAYDAVGGYPALRFSVTEDYALLRAVQDRSHWRVGFSAEPDTTVKTLGLDSPGAVFRQRLRWMRGGLKASPAVMAGGTAVFALHAGIAGGLAARVPEAAGAAALKAFGDHLLAHRGFASRTGAVTRKAQISALHLLTTLIYIPLSVPGLIMRMDAIWKGRRVA
ncbi:MAG: glycosyltransferase [Rubricoccaceae bacterium]